MNNNQKTLKQTIAAVFLLAAMTCAHALDTPHSPTVFNNCVNCHDMSSMNAQLRTQHFLNPLSVNYIRWSD